MLSVAPIWIWSVTYLYTFQKCSMVMMSLNLMNTTSSWSWFISFLGVKKVVSKNSDDISLLTMYVSYEYKPEQATAARNGNRLLFITFIYSQNRMVGIIEFFIFFICYGRIIQFWFFSTLKLFYWIYTARLKIGMHTNIGKTFINVYTIL